MYNYPRTRKPVDNSCFPTLSKNFVTEQIDRNGKPVSISHFAPVDNSKTEFDTPDMYPSLSEQLAAGVELKQVNCQISDGDIEHRSSVAESQISEIMNSQSNNE